MLNYHARWFSRRRGRCGAEWLLAASLLAAGCQHGGNAQAPPTYAYHDAAIPASEHRDIVQALNDLAGADVHRQLVAEIFLKGRGLVLGDRLAPYLEQLLDDGNLPENTRLTVTRLTIECAGSGSKRRLLEFMASEHLFVRRDAHRRLTLLTGNDFGYQYDAAPAERAAAIERARAALGLPAP